MNTLALSHLRHKTPASGAIRWLSWAATLAALMITLPGDAQGHTATASLPAGTNPYSVAVNPATNKIYVANEGNSSVTVIDGATNTTTAIATENGAASVAVNPVTNKIYVTAPGYGVVTVIDGATNNTTTVAVGSYPVSLAVNALTNKIYVANQTAKTVTVIDGPPTKRRRLRWATLRYR